MLRDEGTPCELPVIATVVESRGALRRRTNWQVCLMVCSVQVKKEWDEKEAFSDDATPERAGQRTLHVGS